MNIVFEDKDLIASFKQQRAIFRVFWAITFLFVVLCVVSVIYYRSLPFEDPKQIYPKIFLCVISCIYVIFSYIFLGIKYHRARKYYKLIAYLSVGVKQVNRSVFLRFDEPELKDGIDFYVLIMSEWNKKKSEYMDRKIYFDKEKPCPEFQSGDQVCYLMQGNVIVEYEVTGHDETFVPEKAENLLHNDSLEKTKA